LHIIIWQKEVGVAWCQPWFSVAIPHKQLHVAVNVHAGTAATARWAHQIINELQAQTEIKQAALMLPVSSAKGLFVDLTVGLHRHEAKRQSKQYKNE
jgi:hypothetical protein